MTRWNKNIYRCWIALVCVKQTKPPLFFNISVLKKKNPGWSGGCSFFYVWCEETPKVSTKVLNCFFSLQRNSRKKVIVRVTEQNKYCLFLKNIITNFWKTATTGSYRELRTTNKRGECNAQKPLQNDQSFSAGLLAAGIFMSALGFFGQNLRCSKMWQSFFVCPATTFSFNVKSKWPCFFASTYLLHHQWNRRGTDYSEQRFFAHYGRRKQ